MSPHHGVGIAGAIRLASAGGALVAVAGRGGGAREWRRDGADRLAVALDASTGASSAVSVVILPATIPVRPGPVAVLSPAGSVSSYEIHLGAALAAATGRRVEHLNGCGTSGSAVHSAIASRSAARASVNGWRERPAPRPERALHALSSRPALIVLPVSPGNLTASEVVGDHPDADIVLVFDAAHARHGAAVAQRVASMVELALGVTLALPEELPESSLASRRTSEPPVARAVAVEATVGMPDSAATLPEVRASDIIHVRLTDTALELTNRTRQRIGLRITLGCATEPRRVRAVFETLLEADQSSAEPTSSVAAVADLAAPTAVLRHWSHGDAEVYEGGDRRILTVDVMVLDARREVGARREFDVPNGLDFAVTARDISALIGRADATVVLPDPAPTARPSVPGSEMLAAFEHAVLVGSSALSRRSL